MLSCVALLILAGGLSCGEARGDTVDELSLNEIPQQLVSRAERISQETCQPDVHAVLREMNALMTEQRIQLHATMDRLKDSESLIKEQRTELQQTKQELQQNQQELRAAIGRLTDSESLIKALQGDQSATRQELRTAMERLTDSDSLIKALQGDQSATRQELRTAMERLTDSDSLIKASVETIEGRSNATHHEVQFLQKLNEVRQVSFSASLLASGSGDTGPYNVGTILTYRYVITNVGNGYNPDTGFFIAPVKAVYQFNVFAFGNGGNSPTGASLCKNGQHVVIAYEHQPSHAMSASNGASLLLEAGDVVYVKLNANSWIRDSFNRHSTFSGHLLFTV